MKNNIKVLIKNILTFINHPIVFTKLHKAGCKKFIIGKGGRINSTENVFIGKNSEMGYDPRIIMVKEYWGGYYKPIFKIGSNVSIANHFTALCADKILIEDDNLIASDVVITSHNHGIDPESTSSYAREPLETAPVIIRNGCWIGEKVIILAGVEIGERSIIGAGSIVTKDIPPYSMAVGSPAKVIKQWDKQNKIWKRIEI